MTVLVVGDANVDLELRLPDPDSGSVPANPDPALFGGGSAANTAAALARLEVPCVFVGGVGDDSFGRFAVMSLQEAGVDTAGVTWSTDEPTVAVIVVVQPDGDRLIYVWPPTGGAHGKLESTATISPLESASWLHISGISLRLSPARETLLATMEAARARGIPVSFDLNLRLENWGWEEGFRDVVEAAIRWSDVVMGSAADEITILAGLDDPTAAASSLAGKERLVIARLGANGAVAASEGGVIEAPGFEVQVADTLGAGDAFNAGFIAARLSGQAVDDALTHANAVAALSVTRPGARATTTPTELAGFLQRAT